MGYGLSAIPKLFYHKRDLDEILDWSYFDLQQHDKKITDEFKVYIAEWVKVFDEMIVDIKYQNEYAVIKEEIQEFRKNENY